MHAKGPQPGRPCAFREGARVLLQAPEQRSTGLRLFCCADAAQREAFMSKRKGCKTAVYLCTVPAAFRPQSPWHFPPVVLEAELYAKNLSRHDARGFARAFNKAASANRLADRKWAMAVHWIRPYRRLLNVGAPSRKGAPR